MSCECVSLRLDGLEEKPKTQHKEVNAQCPTQWPATESCFQRRKDHPVRVPRPHAPQPHPHAYLERRLQWIQEDRVTAWLETLQNDSNDSKWDCGISRPTISFATRGLQADPSVTQRCNDTMVQPLTPIPSHEALALSRNVTLFQLRCVSTRWMLQLGFWVIYVGRLDCILLQSMIFNMFLFCLDCVETRTSLSKEKADISAIPWSWWIPAKNPFWMLYLHTSI